MIKIFLLSICMLTTLTFDCCLFATQIEMSEKNKSIDFLKDMLREAIKIAKESAQDPAKTDKFAKIIVDKFALAQMARTAMGPYVKKLSPSQFEEFQQHLSRYFIKTYATKEKVDLFSKINLDEAVMDKKITLNSKKTQMTIHSQFKTKSGDIKTEFVLVKNGNDFDIFDILIENIGLLKNTNDQLVALQSKAKTPDDFIKAFAALA